MSWKFREVYAKNAYEKTVMTLKKSKMPVENCPKFPESEDADNKSQFTLRDLGGPLIILGVAVVVIFICHILWELVRCMSISNWSKYLDENPRAKSSIDYVFRTYRNESNSVEGVTETGDIGLDNIASYNESQIGSKVYMHSWTAVLISDVECSGEVHE